MMAAWSERKVSTSLIKAECSMLAAEGATNSSAYRGSPIAVPGVRLIPAASEPGLPWKCSSDGCRSCVQIQGKQHKMPVMGCENSGSIFA